KHDLEAVNKQLEEAKRQFEEAKRQREKGEDEKHDGGSKGAPSNSDQPAGQLNRTDRSSRRASSQVPANANSAASEDKIVVAYDIPPELVDDVQRMSNVAGIRGEFENGGRFILQATADRQKRFQQLLDATPKWREPEAAKARAQQTFT